MAAKFSAYMQIFNDWSLLPTALRSLSGRIDELVVVDGAYEWMVPYLKALGKNFRRSDERVYAALDESGIPYRVVSGIWKNQLEKRIAGYSSCSHDFIFRVDADEFFLFDDAALEKMLGSDFAVGEMDMPTYVAPGWLATVPGGRYPRQCFLFDRRKVSAEQHLSYLWLVLEADKLPKGNDLPFPIFPRSLAFNAHLTGWRTTDTSINRAGYYTTNWMRGHGVPWLREFKDRPLGDFDAFFQVVSPPRFLDLLELNQIALGKILLEENERIVASPLSPDVEARFNGCYAPFLDSLAALNRRICSGPRTCISGEPVFIDISTAESREPLAGADGHAVFGFPEQISSAEVHVHWLRTESPAYERRLLPSIVEGQKLLVKIPSIDSKVLRFVLEFTVQTGSGVPFLQFRVG